MTLLLGLLMACSGGTLIHEYHEVSSSGWTREDTISFELPKTTRSGDLAGVIAVRHTNSYSYNDLYMLGTLFCDNVEVTTDTLCVRLFETNGSVVGHGFPYTTTTQSIGTVHVDSGHVYTYKVVHVMYPAKLNGITAVGLQLSSD